MSRARTVTRSRVAAAVLAVLLITVAAIGDRLSDLDSENELVRAPLDETVAFEDGAIRVGEVRVATTLVQGDDRLTTQGLFVIVTVTLRASARDSLLVSDTRLLTRSGASYSEAFVGANVTTCAPGFETSRDYAFEVDPARIDGLTLEVWDKGVTFRYYQRTQTPLGITSTNATRWVEAGTGRALDVSSEQTTRAVP